MAGVRLDWGLYRVSRSTQEVKLLTYLTVYAFRDVPRSVYAPTFYSQCTSTVPICCARSRSQFMAVLAAFLGALPGRCVVVLCVLSYRSDACSCHHAMNERTPCPHQCSSGNELNLDRRSNERQRRDAGVIADVKLVGAVSRFALGNTVLGDGS